MSKIPSEEIIRTTLNSYDFDIGKCIDYFVEELGFEGAVVYKDKPGFHLDYHFYKVDDYVYILEGELISEVVGELKVLKKGDFFIFPKGHIHDVRPSEAGAKYIVATENGDFETIFMTA